MCASRFLKFAIPAIAALLTACGGGVSGENTPPSQPFVPVTSIQPSNSQQQIVSGVSLELSVPKTLYQPGEHIAFTARLTNNSGLSLSYYLPSPCSPELPVRFDRTDFYASKTVLGGNREVSGCSGVIVDKVLPSGASVEQLVSWDQYFGVAGTLLELPAGTYPVTSYFTGDLQGDQGFVAEVELQVSLNVRFVREHSWIDSRQAILAALPNDKLTTWFNNNLNNMVCQLASGLYYQVDAQRVFNQVDANAYLNQSRQGGAICKSELSPKPGWKLTFASKQPAGSEDLFYLVDMNANVTNLD